ncbi:hypothetical protein FW784_11165 [Lysobacter lacus]|uniref:Uncharacterized protein n=1 Tax=Cognatilysobacter lacus TaxID=1643323 RepID=A0A5D8YYE0_9GAMM|nr:hypothetical protein FW784_11165 [Lysobacter lacus]
MDAADLQDDADGEDEEMGVPAEAGASDGRAQPEFEFDDIPARGEPSATPAAPKRSNVREMRPALGEGTVSASDGADTYEAVAETTAVEQESPAVVSKPVQQASNEPAAVAVRSVSEIESMQPQPNAAGRLEAATGVAIPPAAPAAPAVAHAPAPTAHRPTSDASTGTAEAAAPVTVVEQAPAPPVPPAAGVPSSVAIADAVVARPAPVPTLPPTQMELQEQPRATRATTRPDPGSDWGDNGVGADETVNGSTPFDGNVEAVSERSPSEDVVNTLPASTSTSDPDEAPRRHDEPDSAV